jgi:hypothetical protein
VKRLKQAQNAKQGVDTALILKQGLTVVDCTAIYSVNAQNGKQSPTGNFPNLYIIVQYPQGNYSQKPGILNKARFKPCLRNRLTSI